MSNPARLVQLFGAILLLAACSGRGVGNPPALCGNGVAEGNENCDGDDVRGVTCLSLGHWDAGTVRCHGDCSGLDTGECYDSMCGDGALQGWAEDCDGTEPNDVTCATLGLGGGILSCGPLCRWDLSQCGCEKCDNRFDDDEDGLVDCDDPECAGVGNCPVELCYDGIDNDGDGLTDCMDSDCAAHAPGCNGGCLLSEDQWHLRCGNGLDDDCDGLDDGDDPDCGGILLQMWYRDVNCGEVATGDEIIYTILLFTAETDLPAVEVAVPMDVLIVDVQPQDGGVYDPVEHSVVWALGDIPAGSGVVLHLNATLDPDPTVGGYVCHQAAVSTSDITLGWISDHPDTAAIRDQTCFSLPDLY